MASIQATDFTIACILEPDEARALLHTLDGISVGAWGRRAVEEIRDALDHFVGDTLDAVEGAGDNA